MINIFRNYNKSLLKQHGLASLLFSIVLFGMIGLTLVSSYQTTTIQEGSTRNVLNTAKAHEAASAGLSYAIPYFGKMKATIIASANNGNIGYSDNNLVKTLPGGGYYEVSYTNPIQFNYNLIAVRSKAIGPDGSVVRVITQYIHATGGNILANITRGALGLTDRLILQNGAKVINDTSNISLEIGHTIEIKDTASSKSTTHTSTSGGINQDVVQNNLTLKNTVPSELFKTLFGGLTEAQMLTKANYVFTGHEDISVDTNGLKDAIIWAENNKITLQSGAVVGTVDKPVILITKTSDLVIQANAKIYGLVVVIGNGKKVMIQGDSKIEGGLVVFSTDVNPDKVDIRNSLIHLKNDEMTARISDLVPGAGGGSLYVPVQGSWHDF